ncbi:MAG: hypothetical protein ACRDKW_16350 [Actinomycetota bacterium]
MGSAPAAAPAVDEATSTGGSWGDNGFGIPEPMLVPLIETARMGLELRERQEVPWRLVPYVGKHDPRLKAPARRQLVEALGRHERFTTAVLDDFRQLLPDEVERFGDAGVPAVIEAVERGDLAGPAWAVCLLVACGRAEDARAVAGWAADDRSGGQAAPPTEQDGEQAAEQAG